MNLHQRIAKALNWELSLVNSLSLYSLRELVKPVSPKLASEITKAIHSESYIVQCGIIAIEEEAKATNKS
jgi:hypothetical protein